MVNDEQLISDAQQYNLPLEAAQLLRRSRGRAVRRPKRERLEVQVSGGNVRTEVKHD